MFESVKNQTPDESRNWRILIASFLLMVVGILTYAYAAGSTEPPKKPYDGVAAGRRIDNLCRNLPKPEGFKFYSGYVQTDQANRRVVIDYHFYSDNRTLEEVIPTFVMWFGENGWTQKSFTNQPYETSLEYVKGSQKIVLESRPYAYDYKATCEEWEAE